MKTSTASSFQPSAFSRQPYRERGVALVLTLGILALVTLLLIAFVTSMRVENMASKNFNDLIKARQLAQAAVDQAVATLRLATPLRSANPPVNYYVTFPGVVYNYNGALPAIPLYTWNPNDLTDSPFDLNDTVNNVYWITGNKGEFTQPRRSRINVGWIYVAEDRTVNPPTGILAPPGAYPIPQPAAPQTKPIIGRFAFWVDDEASKINVNTAGNNWSSGDPYGASDPLAVDLQQLLPLPFAYGPQVASGGPYLRANYPYTTIQEIRRADPVNISADVFNANQFSINTYADDSGDLDAFGRSRFILGNLTPGDIDGTGGGGTSNAYVRLSDPALASLYGGNFVNKYGATGLKQIIANIIAYRINDFTTFWPPDGGSPPAYLGLAKTPYINEVQVKYEIVGTPPSVTVTRTVSVELFYMYDNTYSPGTEKIVVTGLPTGNNTFSDTATITPPAGVYTGPATYRSCPEPAELPVPLPANVNLSLSTPQITYWRDYFGTPRRLHYAQANLPQAFLSTAGGPPVYQGSQANDPAVGPWTPDTTSGSLGFPNPAYTPPGGDDSKSRWMRAGPMQSVGELGYIHTLNPWQHLTLQPGGGATPGQIPDWAILDMFTVGNGKTAGRININSRISPSPLTPRLVPLIALLNSVSAGAAAPQIYLDDNTVRIDVYGMPNVFDTIGEICEIRSLANVGNEKDREAAIRRIANLITTRSNAFTIWAVAQTIKQPPNAHQPPNAPIGTFVKGIDLITGEVKVQAIVQRYEENNNVHFRIKYLRYSYQ